ncbi:hypothetical protein [Dactylosporangium sp. NPDC048998]|uniref:hypothetical protein n=1 Tax=Dactylosporangium sp. NPDC048998 TaxID=3363976 RepID=UPI00371DA0DB
MQAPIIAVHGIGNRQSGMDPLAASIALANRWTSRLAEGYRNAGLASPAPRLTAAYYAHLLDPHSQGGPSDLDVLTPREREWAWAWMNALGVPDDAAQGPATRPFRQALDWLARRRGRPAQALGRTMSALLREVYVYMTRPAVRDQCRAAVIEALDASGAHIVVAHSLGTVVAYEALCAHPDRKVELFVTLGSPLGLPDAIFESLQPAPVDGRAIRPAGVGRWVNLADPGDLVAVPSRLGDRFPVDLHDESYIGAVDFHTLGGYLASGLTAAAISAYV